MNYFIKALKQYVDFDSRASRKEYWMFYLFYMIFYLILTGVDFALGTFVFSTLFGLGLFIPSIAIATRRLHDTSRSGWWQLIMIVPLVGAIVLLVFFAQESHGDNQYGPTPVDLY